MRLWFQLEIEKSFINYVGKRYGYLFLLFTWELSYKNTKSFVDLYRKMKE